METVVDPGGKNTDQDTDQHVLIVDGVPTLGCPVEGGVLVHRCRVNTLEAGNGAGSKDQGDRGVAEEARERGGSVTIAGKSECDGDGEQPAEVIKNGTAGLDKDGGQPVVGAPAIWIKPVTDTHKDGGYRHDGDGAHQCLAKSLQRLDNSSLHVFTFQTRGFLVVWPVCFQPWRKTARKATSPVAGRGTARSPIIRFTMV